MSDNESKDSKAEDNATRGVCHAYLRNACSHGANCKFKHPEGTDRKRNFSFCHDYQNTECRRINCKFLHCTRQEEQQYRLTGELPKNVLDSQDSRKNTTADSFSSNGQWPVCKDYLKGDCRRGSNCRFQHLNLSEYDGDMPRRGMAPGDDYERYERYRSYDAFEPEMKRRAFEDPYGSLMSDGFDTSSRLLPQYNEYYMLEEENYLMRKKVEELKKQISELTATNEFLLDQNAQLRFAKQSSVASVTQSMNSMNAMAMGVGDLAAQCMTPTELTMPMGVPVTLEQGYSFSQMPVNNQGSNLVSYPIVSQRLRPVMPSGLGQ